MGMGRVEITEKKIRESLKFSDDWRIQRIQGIFGQDGMFEMVISGPDFPKVMEGEVVPDVSISSQKVIRWQIKKVDKC